jgi:hypothetical protein
VTSRYQSFEITHTHGEEDIVVTGEAAPGIPGRGGTWEADPEVIFRAVERDDETHAKSTYDEWVAAHGLSRQEIDQFESALEEKALDRLAEESARADRYDDCGPEWDDDERRNDR